MKFLSLLLFFATMNTSNMISAEPTLHYLVRQPKIKSDKPPIILLLHGVRSNEKDLFSFANQLPGRFLVLSLRAPLLLGQDSYAWFQVSFAGGKPTANVEQSNKSRLLILQFIEQIKTKFRFDTTQVYLCGFSQGAIMAYNVCLTNPDKIKGVAIMSGRLMDEIKPLMAPIEKLNPLKIFISHGVNDNVLVINYARDGYAYLKQLGLNPTYKEYNEGHTISSAMLADMIGWLH